MPDLGADWWTAQDVAAYLKIARGTWAGYVTRKQAPEPDRTFGGTPVWKPQTIVEWNRRRPGKGWRQGEKTS